MGLLADFCEWHVSSLETAISGMEYCRMLWADRFCRAILHPLSLIPESGRSERIRQTLASKSGAPPHRPPTQAAGGGESENQ